MIFLIICSTLLATEQANPPFKGVYVYGQTGIVKRFDNTQLYGGGVGYRFQTDKGGWLAGMELEYNASEEINYTNGGIYVGKAWGNFALHAGFYTFFRENDEYYRDSGGVSCCSYSIITFAEFAAIKPVHLRVGYKYTPAPKFGIKDIQIYTAGLVFRF